MDNQNDQQANPMPEGDEVKKPEEGVAEEAAAPEAPAEGENNA